METARDRRMDIAALCEPLGDGDGAFDLEVRAQLRRIAHHSRPLHRVEQDRMLWRSDRSDNDLHASDAAAASRLLKPQEPPRLLPPLLSRVDRHDINSRIAVLSTVALSSASTPSSTTHSTSIFALKPPVAPLSAKKRTRRMTNSERGKLYRSRRKNYVETLEDEVQQLRQELQGLQLYGGLLQDMALHAPHVSGSAYSRVVSEYFTVFASGMPVDSDAVHGGELARVQPTPRQAVFVRTLLDAKMEFCGDGGPSRLLGNWKAFSLYHSSLRYTLEHLHVVVLQAPTAVVTADAVLHVRLTRATVEHMFPHVLWNAALVQRLVGRDVTYHVHNVFYFGASGKVVRYESHVDFLGAFIAALGSVRDAVELAGPISERQQREQFADRRSKQDSSGGGEGTATDRSSSSSSTLLDDLDEDPDATK